MALACELARSVCSGFKFAIAAGPGAGAGAGTVLPGLGGPPAASTARLAECELARSVCFAIAGPQGPPSHKLGPGRPRRGRRAEQGGLSVSEWVRCCTGNLE